MVSSSTSNISTKPSCPKHNSHYYHGGREIRTFTPFVKSIRTNEITVAILCFVVAVVGAIVMSTSQIQSPRYILTQIYRVSRSIGMNGVTFVTTSVDYNESTEDRHRSSDSKLHGRYKDARSKLDYSFHSRYSKERVHLQDSIVESILSIDTRVNDQQRNYHCEIPFSPWIVFTAGAMGAGKTYSIRLLDKKGLFPLRSFIAVDPDQIRQKLPEFEMYVQYNPENAGYLTRKESGMISEIVIQTALERGQNVLVDGTLRDSQWYRDFFHNLRHLHPTIRIAIIHVTAPRERIFEHALRRAKVTGRVVPRQLLEATIEQVPRSVQELTPLVDYVVELHNSGNDDNVRLIAPGIDWDDFRKIWDQTCPEDSVQTNAKT